MVVVASRHRSIESDVTLVWIGESFWSSLSSTMVRRKGAAFHEKSELRAQKASARTHLRSRCSQQSSKGSELHRP